VSTSAISTGAASWAMIALVRALGDCCVAIWLFGGQTDNLGLMHVPRPVEPGDVLALASGPPLRVTVLVQLPPGGKLEAVAEVEPVERGA
jgi:hypothetical protein